MINITIKTPIKSTRLKSSRDVLEQQFLYQHGDAYDEAFKKLNGDSIPLDCCVALNFHQVGKPTENRVMHLNKADVRFITRQVRVTKLPDA